MTKEEAIRLIGWLKCTTNREDDLEAIDMAIKALKKEAERQEMVIRASERHFTKTQKDTDRKVRFASKR